MSSQSPLSSTPTDNPTNLGGLDLDHWYRMEGELWGISADSAFGHQNPFEEMQVLGSTNMGCPPEV